MANTCGKIGYDREYIDSILTSLDVIDNNIEFVTAALDSLNQYLNDNKMSGVEMILKDDIDKLRNYFQVDNRSIIEDSKANISGLSDGVEELDNEWSKNVN